MITSSRIVLTVVGLTLATLGILGVAAVETMAEVGQGSAKAVAQTIKSMGANNLLVMPGTASTGGVSFGGGSVMTLTPQDADAVARECPAVNCVAPVVRARTQLTFANKNWVPLYIYGTTPSFLEVREWTDLEEGEPFTDADVRNGARVCLVGQTIKRELFNDQSPLGREIRLQNVAFKVVGVLSARGANMMGLDQDDIVLAPWSTIKARISNSTLTHVNQSTSGDLLQDTGFPRPAVPPTSVDQILVRIDTEPEIPGAVREITALLRERHRLRPGQPDDFNIRDMTEFSKALSATTATMTRSLLGAAVLPLLVGGVGLMLLMLVSAARRAQAIGRRLAAGTRRGSVLRQLLMEAVLLGLAGGIIGVMLGRVGSYLVWQSLHWPVTPSLPAVLATLGASVAVGLVFGSYPAWKASRLKPIAAQPDQ
jgi:ABC-type antimicrobial peptide transport system permease subunit